jgi:hypothetical protein
LKEMPEKREKGKLGKERVGVLYLRHGGMRDDGRGMMEEGRCPAPSREDPSYAKQLKAGGGRD